MVNLSKKLNYLHHHGYKGKSSREALFAKKKKGIDRQTDGQQSDSIRVRFFNLDYEILKKNWYLVLLCSQSLKSQNSALNIYVKMFYIYIPKLLKHFVLFYHAHICFFYVLST